MNYKTAAISAISAFTFAIVIACGAQNDSLSTIKVLVQELMDDPLTEQIRANHQKQQDLIMYNNLNMDGLSDLLENTVDNDPCKVEAAKSNIPNATEYFENMCRHIKLIDAVKQQHPVVLSLDADTRIKIFYSSEPVTVDDVMLMMDARYKID